MEYVKSPFEPLEGGYSFADTLIRNPSSPWVLVACCGKKLEHIACAQDLYQSELFKKSKAWAERYGIAWFILSAKYGVVPPGRMILPYDETLNNKSHAELTTWNRKVLGQLGVLSGNRKTVVLAGANYRGWIPGQSNVVVPMQGLGIGQQLSWLKSEMERASVNEAIASTEYKSMKPSC